MKYFLNILLLASTVWFGSCASSKKTSTSKTKQTTKEPVANAPAHKEKVKDKVKPFATKPADAKVMVVTPEFTYSPLPSDSVSNAFKKNYPLAGAIRWDDIEPTTKTGKLYKANFTLDNVENVAVYTSNGNLIETRTEIMPAQLPEIIYSALKTKYSDAEIISATTYKNSKNEGTYTAIVHSVAFKSTNEYIVTEKGLFIE